MKKPIVAILLTLVLVLSLAGCGKGNDLETAQSLIGADVADLVAAIGEPSGSEYATSCLGAGEDGEWYYDGFTVYTYKPPQGAETVFDVMEAN